MANGAFKSRQELDVEAIIRTALPSDGFIVDSHLTPHAGENLLKIRVMSTRPHDDAERIARVAWSAASTAVSVPVEVTVLNELLGHAEDARWDSGRESASRRAVARPALGSEEVAS